MIDLARTAAPPGARGIVQRLEYDPNRSARIALLQYEPPAAAAASTSGAPVAPATPTFAYVIAPEGVKAGDALVAGRGAGVFPGHALPLRDLPVGTTIHNIEMRPGGGGQLVRAAGTSATLVKKGDDGYAIVRLASGETRRLRGECVATVGAVGNKEHHNRKIGKAGNSRHMGATVLSWIHTRPCLWLNADAPRYCCAPQGGGRTFAAWP